MCVCVCVCMQVQVDRNRETQIALTHVSVGEQAPVWRSVCVCVCVCNISQFWPGLEFLELVLRMLARFLCVCAVQMYAPDTRNLVQFPEKLDWLTASKSHLKMVDNESKTMNMATPDLESRTSQGVLHRTEQARRCCSDPMLVFSVLSCYLSIK